MPKTVAIIPARYDSSRFPKKLTYELLGKPIIIAVYDNVKAVSEIDDVIIATDSKEIMDICSKNNAKAIMTSKSHTSGTSRIIEAAKKIDCDIIYMCSPNNPTGAVYDKAGLKAWVDYAKSKNAIILFDSAYEFYVTDKPYKFKSLAAVLLGEDINEDKVKQVELDSL